MKEMTLTEWAGRICNTTSSDKFLYTYEHKDDKTIFTCWSKKKEDFQKLVAIWGLQ